MDHFPALLEDYKTRFGTADFASQAYSRKLAEIVASACKKHGLRPRSNDDVLTRKAGWDGIQELMRRPPQKSREESQQRLFA